MNRIKVIPVVGILSLFAVTAAVAQSAPANLPFHTLYGRLGAEPGDTGPGQAIPFITLENSFAKIRKLNHLCHFQRSPDGG
jgi:hypothetical protein